jgi:hypothetical protein
MATQICLKTYANFIFETNKIMPPTEQDILRISDLHSWYKHLSKFQKAYPLLIQGEEPRYSFSPCFTDPNQKNFHWTVIMDYNIDNYYITVDGKEIEISDDIKKFMKKFPIYLNNHFCSSDDPLSQFLLQICNKMCHEFWDELKKLE